MILALIAYAVVVGLVLAAVGVVLERVLVTATPAQTLGLGGRAGGQPVAHDDRALAEPPTGRHGLRLGADGLGGCIQRTVRASPLVRSAWAGR